MDESLEGTTTQRLAVCSDLEGNGDATDVDKAVLLHVFAFDGCLGAVRTARVRMDCNIGN